MATQLGQSRPVDASRDQGRRNLARSRAPGHDQRRLAQRGLRVALAFAGDSPVGAVERGVESDQVGDDLRTRAHLAADQLQREAQAAGGAGAGLVLRTPVERTLGQRSEVRDAAVDLGDALAPHAFLRAEDRSRAPLAGQRIIDVRHHDDPGVGKPRVEATRVDGRERGEAGGRRLDRTAARVGEREPERREQPGAAVIGAAATQAYHEAANAGIETIAYHFADAQGRAMFDVDGGHGRIGQAHDLRDFEHRGNGLAYQSISDGHRLARDIADASGQSLSAAREYGVERAFAAIGHRTKTKVGVWPDAAQAFGDCRRGVRCRQRSFERIRGEHNGGRTSRHGLRV